MTLVVDSTDAQLPPLKERQLPPTAKETSRLSLQSKPPELQRQSTEASERAREEEEEKNQKRQEFCDAGESRENKENSVLLSAGTS